MNKDNPLVSIITVVYNGSKTLEQTIQSVSSQSYKNIEYIIIDGGSTDGTLDIIKNYKNSVNFWITEPDKGLYDAMNKGILYANGEIIGLINSDDWYETNAVELVVEAYRNDDSKKIFHADKRCVLPNGVSFVRKANRNNFLFKYHGMILNHPTMFIHKEIYQNRKYNINLKSLSDYQFVLSAFIQDKNSFHYIPEIITNYRLGGISGHLPLTQSIKENFIARRNAGMNILECSFAVMIRIAMEIYRKIK